MHHKTFMVKYVFIFLIEVPVPQVIHKPESYAVYCMSIASSKLLKKERDQELGEALTSEKPSCPSTEELRPGRAGIPGQRAGGIHET